MSRGTLAFTSQKTRNKYVYSILSGTRSQESLFFFKNITLHCIWKVKVLVCQLCLTPFDPMDCSQLGSSIHGILQARKLEWLAVPFFRGSSRPRDWLQASHIAGRFFTAEPPGKPCCTVFKLSFSEFVSHLRWGQELCFICLCIPSV